MEVVLTKEGIVNGRRPLSGRSRPFPAARESPLPGTQNGASEIHPQEGYFRNGVILGRPSRS
jgi:hypothetical protein